MKASVLNRHYPDLTPDERFHLALAAIANGDEAERERLRLTCPRYTYTMNDADFADRIVASHTVCLFFAAWWQWNATRCLHAIDVMVACRAGKMEPPMGLTVEIVTEIATKHADCMKGVWAGFARFCDAIRVEPDHILHWWNLIRSEIARWRTVLDSDHFIPDVDMQETTYAMLAMHWPGLRETLPEWDT
jgi:hypothetical protein